MKTILEYIQKKHINKIKDNIPEVYIINKDLSKELNFNAVMYLCDDFYNLYTTSQINTALRKMDEWRCPLSQADDTMEEFLTSEFSAWCEDKLVELENNPKYEKDCRIIKAMQEDYFDVEDFFLNMPDKKEFKKLQKEYENN